MRRFLFLALLLLLALPLAAESTRFWRQDKYEEFNRGRARGVALRSDGELLLAPRFAERADASMEFLWTLVQDTAGNLYAGGGSPAKVIRVDRQGKISTFFESKELEVRALAFDHAGNLLVATSPDGNIYRVTPAGQSQVFFNPERKYIWDILVDATGQLYVATGDKGEIFRVAPDGSGTLFFSSAETHVRVLARDAAGNLLAGTEPSGRVIRVTPAGQGFVLYETPRREITALSYDAQGNLFVGALGQKGPTPGIPVVPTTVPPTATTVVTPQGVTTQFTQQPLTPAPTARLPLAAAGGSAIFRIAPDGYAEEWWSSDTDLVYTLAFDKDRVLLAGTGNEGQLLAIASPTLFTNLVKSSAGQVTTLLRAGDGSVYVGTANPGKIYTLGPDLESEGTFESDVFDARLFSTWGRISWRSRSSPALGSVTVYTRSGNTSDPQKHWSPWSANYTNPDGEPIVSPPARFLQWRAVLAARDSRTPSLSGVSVAYLRRNVAPVVDKVIVQAPGIRVRGIPLGQQGELVQLELPPPAPRQVAGAIRVPTPQQQGQRVEPPPQGIADKGARSVIWSASDDNDDELEYTLYYRAEADTQWKLLKDKLRERFFTWDAETLADGAYYLKVVASDGPSNPTDRAQTGEAVSDRFEVDNTPPRIEELIAQTRSRSAEIRFTARDTFSPIRKAEYSLNAAPWQQIFPTKGVTDSPLENYLIPLGELAPGEHTVVVRAYDQHGNVGMARVTFTIR